MAATPRTPKAPSRREIARAVASSTAIETGKPVKALEKKLLAPRPAHLRELKLAR
ncbi:hypothetical protein [Cognatilysobacter segetis]|uniref:hypothetical protein n=1 Tax=Cognatilysobacter segetis TaxID=2492394 RepID=UPI00192E3E4B|nr:hypothetical protein [Lysobacter segetis]